MASKATDGAPQQITRAHITGAVLGIALEVYDFTTYSYFAVSIAHAFFPARNVLVGLMLSLGTFGAGFLSRPLGAWLIGRYADRVGRRPAMVLSFLLMGAGILVLAVTPPFAKIGIAAPLLVLTARLTQGIALGGEVGATTAFLIEAAPPGKRGLYCALQYGGQGLAAVLAGIIGVTLSAILSKPDLDAYGWRIAMLLGVAILPIGLIIRRSMPETLPQRATADAARPPPLSPETRRVLILGLLVISSGAVSNQIFHYMTTYATTVLHLSAGVGLAVPAVTGFCIMTFGVISGAVSDRIGRRVVMFYPAALGLVATYPVFLHLFHHPSALTLLGGIGLLAFLGACSAGASITAIMEAIPAHIRSTSFSLIYASALAIFAGSAQFVVTWLIYVTGNGLAPAWYALAAGAVGLVARMLMRETAPALASAGVAR
jgi:MFS family permease